MGLDMTAFTMKAKPAKPVDFNDTRAAKLFYWRKHPNLHGWMEQLYRSKGGTDGDFNWVAVEVTAEDLDALEKAVNGQELPETSGFFFGRSSEERVAEDREFIAKARAAIAAGEFVGYTSWW